MRQLLVGIDVGTTFCKALMLDFEGEVLGVARERTPWRHLPTGAELDSDAVARTVHVVASRALDESPIEALANGVTVGWHVIDDRWALVSGNELNMAPASVLRLLDADGQAERDALNAAAAELTAAERPLRLDVVGDAGPMHCTAPCPA